MKPIMIDFNNVEMHPAGRAAPSPFLDVEEMLVRLIGDCQAQVKKKGSYLRQA
jgi:hypothetical protein